MNPEAVLQILRPLALPLIWSFLVMFLAWRRRDQTPGASGPFWAGAAAIAGAMVLGICVDLRPQVLMSWSEPKAVPAQAAIFALIVGLLHRWLRPLATDGWLAAPLVAVFAALVSRYPGLADQRLTIIACWTIGTLIVAFAAVRLSALREPLAQLQLAIPAVLAAPLLFTVSLGAGKSSSWLAGSMGMVVVVSWLLARRGVNLAIPGGVVLVFTLATLLFFGVYGNDLPAWQAGLVGLCFVSAAISRIGAIGRLTGWKGAFVKIALAATPALVALAFAIPRAIREAGDAI